MTNQADAVELLISDHRTIDELAEELDTIDDPVELERVYCRIVDLLLAHEAAEHEVVFPAFRATLPPDDDTVERRESEHDELNDVLAEMRSLAPDSFGFVKRASALLLDVQGHFEREEETVFVRMRETMSADELVELGRRTQAVMEREAATGDASQSV